MIAMFLLFVASYWAPVIDNEPANREYAPYRVLNCSGGQEDPGCD